MSTLKRKIPEILGIDLGNTIISENRPLPDAFRVIRRLINERFGENVHIVSRVNEQQEIRARAFVTSLEFRSNLDIPMERIHFCRERHEKGPICLRIGMTHFIDDRPEVMAHMPHVAHRILFDPSPSDVAAFRDRIGDLPAARNWLEVEKLLLVRRR